HFFLYSFVCLLSSFFFFFFQAEDGIRDRNVTGVQTCALPIYENIKACALTSLTYTTVDRLSAGTASASSRKPLCGVFGLVLFPQESVDFRSSQLNEW